jgi:hypothetical protein
MNFSSSPCLVAASHRTIQFLFIGRRTHQDDLLIVGLHIDQLEKTVSQQGCQIKLRELHFMAPIFTKAPELR